MDTSSEAGNTDTLGRRTRPRQKHTIEEKRRIVEETHGKRLGNSSSVREGKLGA
jgi:hypothetical protein